MKSPPAIGDDGTIYFGSWDDYLYALYPDGTLKWKLDCYSSISSSPAIGADGTIYVGAYSGTIFSVDIYGNENWRYQTGDYVLSSPAIDKNGVVYVGSFDGTLYALNHDGTLWWKFFTGGDIQSSPVIDENGIIYSVAEFTEQNFYSYLYAIEVIDDNPPVKPSIDGTTGGKIWKEYTYTAVTSDPNGDKVSYFFDWDDGTNSGWTEFVPSGTSVSRGHSWKWSGTYTIRVKAKDEYDMESDWETLEVTMPRNKATYNSLFLKLLEHFPILQKILCYIL